MNMQENAKIGVVIYRSIKAHSQHLAFSAGDFSFSFTGM